MEQSCLNTVCTVPDTESIKYAGSKLKILPNILEMVRRTGTKTVLDGFSGTTRVSQALAQQGYHVLSNDVSAWSTVLGTCYLLNDQPRSAYRELINHLNAVEPVDSWFTEHYGGLSNGGCSVQADGLKKPWQVHNTRKLDGIRLEIERLDLSPVEKAVALTSLMLGMDRVDSTLGHFTSYLKDWSKRSYKDLVLEVPRLFESPGRHEVYQQDIFDAAPTVEVDLAYFDPPYGSNNEKMPPSRVRYASYYHVWTTICEFDEPEVFGKAKRRVDTSDRVATSVFEEFRTDEDGKFMALKAIDRLIEKTAARWILLSYSSGGRATADELNEILSTHGTLVDVVEIDYKRNIMAEMKWTGEWLRDAQEPNREFLFLLEK